MINLQRPRQSVIIDKLLLIGVILTLLIGVTVPILKAALAHAANEDLSAVADTVTAKDQWVNITDLQITGSDNDEVSITVHAPSGSFGFGVTTATITGTGTNSAVLTGSRESVNQTLASMRYKNTTAGDYTITADLGGGDGDVYNPANQHVYQVITSADPVPWNVAKSTAEGMTYGGVSGYLATITSQQEQDFIIARIHQDGWIGATDTAHEGDWRWVTGPEGQEDEGQGLLFWQGTGDTGHVVPGQYQDWDQTKETSNEPNNSGDNENCAQIRFASNANGRWNDLPCNSPSVSAYVVEFGAPGALPTVAHTAFTVTVTAPTPTSVPVMTTTTPANGATNVNPNTPLVMTFDKLTYASEGNLKLHNETDNTSQDILNQEGWSDLTISGNIVTVNWRSGLALQPCATYYVEIPNNIFWYSDGATTAYYDGMNSPYTWRFSTQCSSPSGFDAHAIAMHGKVIDKTTNNPVPYAWVNLSCGEGGDTLIQANASGAYSVTMGQLKDAISNPCFWALGIDMYASADGYETGDFEWTAYDRSDQDWDNGNWENWIAAHFGGQKFDFHLIGDGSNENGGGNTAHAITFANNVTGANTTVELGNNCTVGSASAFAKGAIKDAGYEYKSGLVQFDAECSGNSTQVKVYQFGVSDNNLVLRKYNPEVGYYTIDGATITQQTVNGQKATVATYTIQDNGDLDLDKRPGYISDPVGLGSLSVGTPNTGVKRISALW